jgi:hypothetical protein
LGQDVPDFIDTQHDRQFVSWAWAEQIERGPGLAEGVLK